MQMRTQLREKKNGVSSPSRWRYGIPPCFGFSFKLIYKLSWTAFRAFRLSSTCVRCTSELVRRSRSFNSSLVFVFPYHQTTSK